MGTSFDLLSTFFKVLERCAAVNSADGTAASDQESSDDDQLWNEMETVQESNKKREW